MKILVIRHGESESNKQKIIAGQTVDKSLTTKGQAQARATAQNLKGRNIKKIISSHLKRAKETAEIIAEHFDLEVEIIPELAEVDYGKISGQPEDKTQRNMERSFEAKTGENSSDLEKRALKIIKKIKQLPTIKGDVLLVGHKTFNSILFAVWQNTPKEKFLEYRSKWTMENAEAKKLN